MKAIEEALQYIDIIGDGCWFWRRGKTAAGYGEANLDGRIILIHRAIFEHFRGPIPSGLELDHLCRNRACCNPTHLEAVPHRVNLLRGESPMARQARQTHCIAGHEFSPSNTLIVQGQRRCRECVNRRNRETYERRFGHRGNAQSRKTHCPSGHPYDADNTYHYRGERHCKACMRDRAILRRNARASR